MSGFFTYNYTIKCEKIRIYILFDILLMSLKNISIICYNIKVRNIYTYTFNQNFKKPSFVMYTN